MWCYIYTAAGAVPSGKPETSSYITPGVLFKGADANSLAALLHACATVSTDQTMVQSIRQESSMDSNTDTLIPDKWKCLAVQVAKYGSIC